MSSFEIDRIRSDFPILGTSVHGNPLIYFDNAATTHKPRSVLDTIYSFYSNSYSNIHRGVHFLSEKATELFENSRNRVRKFINAKKSREIIFTQGTTASINIVAQCFGNCIVKEGDEVLVSGMEHHSNFVPWQILCKNKGAIFKIIPLDEDGCLQMDMLQQLLSKKTKLLAISHVSNVTGIINPVKKIIDLAHAHTIPVLIDGAQSIAHIPVDVTDLDCDFYAFSGHKIYAGTGTGILYGKEQWLDMMPPYQYGGGMISTVKNNYTTFAELPYKFEAGTQNLEGAMSLYAAIEYIDAIGIKQIEEYENHLTSYALHQLTMLDNIHIYSAQGPKSGIVSFNFKNISPYDVCLYLDHLGIALRSGHHCAQPIMDHFRISGTARLSFALYNTKDEIDQCIDGLKKVQIVLQ